MEVYNINHCIEDISKIFDEIYLQWGEFMQTPKEEKLKKYLDLITSNDKFPQMYVVKEDNNIIATFTFTDAEDGNSNSALLKYVLVLPKYRVKGYGRIVLNLIDKIAQENYQKVFLFTEHIGFYEKIGFQFQKTVDLGGETNRLYFKLYN